jgi:hypothetical protein
MPRNLKYRVEKDEYNGARYLNIFNKTFVTIEGENANKTAVKIAKQLNDLDEEIKFLRKFIKDNIKGSTESN